MTRAGTIAASLWTGLAVAAGTGCIPIFSPIVEVQPTTGEQLRAIQSLQDDIRHGTEQGDVSALGALRVRLLREPPSYVAIIETYSDSEYPVLNYSLFNPGLYMPLDRERSDLKRAHQAGLLTDDELADLLAALDQQARRSLVRRWFETCPYAAFGSVHIVYFQGHYFEAWTEHHPDSLARMNAAREWNADSLAGKTPAVVGDRWNFPSTSYSRIVMTPTPTPTPEPTPEPTPDPTSVPAPATTPAHPSP